MPDTDALNIIKIKHSLIGAEDVKDTLNSTYYEVTFNEKLAITKENVCTKYTTYTYKYVTINEKPPIMKQNLCILFLL